MLSLVYLFFLVSIDDPSCDPSCFFSAILIYIEYILFDISVYDC